MLPAFTKAEKKKKYIYMFVYIMFFIQKLKGLERRELRNPCEIATGDSYHTL